MTRERDQGDRKEGPERREGAPAYRKERETKEDGRYIIFYTFEDEEPPDEGTAP